MPHLEFATTIKAPPAACFDLSLSVDAHMASMGDRSNERAIAGVTAGLMRLGDTVTWRGRHFGLPFRLTSKIIEYERPVRFVDEQVRGPFRSWHHEHLFEPLPTGATKMLDRIDFRSPAGLVGVLVDRLVLTRYMSELILRRNGYLRATLEAQR